jgi:peptidyl-prolyl cis-trans isomerase SurA
MFGFLTGCSPQEHESVVATVGSRAITLREFEQQYEKSLGATAAPTASTQEEREKFLDLLVNYHLKLAGAYKEGIDKRAEVLNELGAYKGNLAQTYLTEREVVAPGLMKLYSRQGEEIRASHILLNLAPTASPADSIAAYKKAYDIIAQLKAGKDFGDLAVQYSTDPSAKTNRGDLYYFTAGQLVQQFEDAAYAMKSGQISSEPVRTRFGLHIIKITDRKPTRGEIHAAHIMIRFPGPSPTPDDTLAAYKKIAAIRDSIKLGTDFGALAQRNSDDPGSASKGGDLGFFGRRRWVQSFDEAALAMNPGQVSGIVRSPYGYHIIRCIEVHPRKSFDDARKDLEQVYRQLHFAEDNARFIDSLKREVRFSRNDVTLNLLVASFDTTRTTRDSAWWSSLPSDVAQRTLFSVLGRQISVDSALAALRMQPESGNLPLRRSGLEPALEKVGEQFAFSAKANLLEAQVPAFKSLMKEYSEGILLYQIEQENVWNKLAVNDSVLAEYFQAHRSSFTWPDRINFTEVRSSTDSSARKIRSLLAGGKSIEEIANHDSIRMAAPTSYRVQFAARSTTLSRAAKKALDVLVAELHKDPAVRLSISCRPDTSVDGSSVLKLANQRLGAVRRYVAITLRGDTTRFVASTVPMPRGARSGDSTLAQSVTVSVMGRLALIFGKVEMMSLPMAADERAVRADSLTVGSYSPPFAFKSAYSIIRLNGREKAREKTMEEAGADLSSSYQDYASKNLEREWLERLRKDFPVVENKARLKDAFLSEH